MPIVKVTPEMAATAAQSVDWAAIDAMTDENIAEQVAANPDAAPLLDDAESSAAAVRYVRQKLGLSQSAFSERYRIPIATLRDWEQGRHTPDGTTMAYLQVINREPELTARALEHDRRRLNNT